MRSMQVKHRTRCSLPAPISLFHGDINIVLHYARYATCCFVPPGRGESKLRASRLRKSTACKRLLPDGAAETASSRIHAMTLAGTKVQQGQFIVCEHDHYNKICAALKNAVSMV
jgi:hypothetical protein